VAVTYRMSVQHLQSKKRDLLTVEAKRVAIHLLSASGQGASAIGRQMCLDHSTVLHHLRHAPLDRWQQQLVSELQRDLHRLAARAQISGSPASTARRSSDSLRTLPGARPCPGIPTLGRQTDQLQVINMPR
jgi:hypothetical protein